MGESFEIEVGGCKKTLAQLSSVEIDMIIGVLQKMKEANEASASVKAKVTELSREMRGGR